MLLASLPAHFTSCLDGSGNVFNATVLMPTASSPDVNGTPLPNGSEIAVFSSDAQYPNLCVGVLVWQGSHSYITVWGDNDLTSVRDGLRPNESLAFRVWDSASGTEYSGGAVQIRYTQGNGRYQHDSILRVSDLSVVSGPVAPILASPSNGATGVSINPTLVWNALPGNNLAYDVQLARASDPTFNAPVVNTTVTQTSHNVTGLNHGTAYHWRIRARSEGGTSPWATPFVFTTEGAPTQAPSAPFLTQPAHATTRISTHPALAWQSTFGATSYRVQISRDDDRSFGILVVDVTVTTPFFDVEAIELLTATTYRWRVQGRNQFGNGPWSNPFTFTTANFNITLAKVFINTMGLKVAKVKWPVQQVSTGKVDVYQDNLFVKRTGNDGIAKHKINSPQTGPFNLFFCEKGSTTLCSNTLAAEFSTATLDLTEEDDDEDDEDYAVSYDVEAGGMGLATLTVAAEAPTAVQFQANYPNPFQDATTMAFGLPRTTHVSMEIYNMLGKRVATLLDEPVSPGWHNVAWYARDMPSGIYVCRMQTDGMVLTRTLTLIK